MKKTASIVLGILMLSNLSFAKDITLEEAVNLAIENDSSIIMLKAEKRQQEKEYNDVKKETNTWQNKQAYSFQTAEEYFLHTGDALQEAKLKYDLYLKSIENAKNKVEYNLINSLYNLELAESNIKLLEKNVELLERQKLVHELKFNLKMISQVDLDNFILSYNESKNNLENAKNQYDLARENLKLILGQTEEVNVILPEIESKELTIEDIDKFISENINNNKNIIELNYNYKKLEKQHITMKKSLYTDEYEMMTDNIKLQKKIVEDNYNALGTQVKLVTNNMSTLYKSYYNNIKSSELDIQVKFNQLKLAKDNMKVIESRYQDGYIAELDYQAAKLGVEQNEIAYRRAVIDNVLLNIEFEKFVETGFTKGA